MKATYITPQSCSVVTQIDGTLHRKAYENSEAGRAEFIAECAACENVEEVLAAWSDSPTVVYTPEETEDTPLTDSERITVLEQENAYLKETLEIILSGATEEEDDGESVEEAGV